MNRNCLDRKEMRQLEDLVESHKAEIEAGKWTQQSFANHASKRVGRPVTPVNVAGAARTMNVAFPKGKNGEALKSNRELKAAIRVLASAIVRLAGELGTGVAPEVVSLSEVQQEGG